MKKSTKFIIAFLTTLSVFMASCVTSLIFSGCSLFMKPESLSDKKNVTAVTFAKTYVTVQKGGSEYLKYTVKPTEIQNSTEVTWAYDPEIISIEADRYGVIVTGLKTGQSYLKATANNITAACIITVEGNGEIYEGEPYIYSNSTVVELTPGSNKTVSASLYGGSSADLEEFTWTIKDPAVADIDYARGSCVITAKKKGSTQITVSHPDARFDYTMVVYVYTDNLTASYITTSQNVLMINKNETLNKTVTFDIVNPVTSNYQGGFTYEVITTSGSPSFSVTANGNTAIITPETNGLSILRVSHENCEYSLDVLVRVTTSVRNVYIETSASTLVCDGSENSYSIFADIRGTEDTNVYVNPEEFVWTVYDTNGNSLTEAEWQDYMDCQSSGNQFTLTGKKNNAYKVKVSHPLSEYSRTVLVILRNQQGSAIDASMYITTSSNYVKTKAGAETVEISVQLMGGERGDENDLVWTIDNGENNDICKIITPTGNIHARKAGSVTDGSLYITPLKPGTATITVSHPKILYTTDIIVKVLSEYALMEEPAYINTETTLVKMLNGSTKEISAELSGNISPGDENGLAWESETPSVISVSPSSGETVVLDACGTGENQTKIKISHNKALSVKEILVLSADTQEALDSMKAIISGNTYFRINEGGTCTLELEPIGLAESDMAGITWTTEDPGVAIVSAGDTRLKAQVTGIKSGTTKVTAGLAGCKSCTFNITVLPEGEETGVVTSKYLTTDKNAVVITVCGESTDLSVTGVNLTEAEMALTEWTIEDETVASVTANGKTATVTARTGGKTKITVTNRESENSVTIDLKVGALYEWTDDFYVYITTEEDTVTLVKGETKTIGAALENSTAKNGFMWSVTGKSGIVEATGNAGGTCYLEALEAGMTELTIRNTNADFEKTVLVVVANSPEELAELKYLTTKQNVVTIGETYNETVTVSVKNAPTDIIDGYHWESSDPTVIKVVESGNVAVLYGQKQGTAKITVTNDYCDYPLEIIANCVDPVLAAENPYISCDNIVTLTVGDGYKNLFASLVGGSPADNLNFSWHCQNPEILSLYSSNNTAQVKAIKEGVTQIVISHPKAQGIDRTVLVICEPETKTDCYITLTESIIKMSPQDPTRTITATLVNGTESDKYNFKWWADSYEIIDMNYTGESCVVTPISTGFTTIHCSHPKAAYQKDIIVNISQYSEFAFAKDAVSVTKGKQTFVNMEVPTLGTTTTKVVYKAVYPDGSPASDIMGVSGTKSVCILDPKAAGTCIIQADLVAAISGIIQGSCQLLVNIEDSSEAVTYIDYSGSTVITLEKGETRSLKAMLAGASAVTGDEKYLKWKSSDTNVVSISPSPTSSGWTMNDEIRITGLSAGKEATVTISCDRYDGISSVILYIIVPGENVANILLDRTALNLVQGDGAQSITASVTNPLEGDYDNLVWEVEQDGENPVIKLSGSGKKVSVFPQNTGTALVRATVPSSLRTAECTVTVEPPKQIILDRQTVNCYPGEEFKITYTVSPENEAADITWTTSDSSYVGFTDDHAGTLTCYGKFREGTCTITGTTPSKAKASFTVTNGWGNTLSLSKTLIKTVPVYKSDGTFDIEYELKPSCAELHIQATQFTGANGSVPPLKLAEGTYTSYDAGTGLYTVTKKDFESVNTETGTAGGTLRFIPVGESNGPVVVTAYNPVSIDGEAPLGAFAEQTIDMQICYTSLDFTLSDFRADGAYSYYDSASKVLVIGDGETVTFRAAAENKNASPVIDSVVFTKYAGNYNGEKISCGKNPASGNSMIESSMSVTYGTVSGDPKSSSRLAACKDFNMTNGFYRADNTDDGDKLSNEYNDRIMEHLYIGTLDINYTTYFGTKDSYSIPVYLDIRNCCFDYKK